MMFVNVRDAEQLLFALKNSNQQRLIKDLNSPPPQIEKKQKPVQIFEAEVVSD